MMILFGGGDGGGIYIHNGKVEIIPPFSDPALQRLRTINQLLHFGHAATGPLGKDAVALATKLTQEVLVGGVIIVEGEFVFADVDGGFWCGSNGQHLIPFPTPRPGIFSPALAMSRTLAGAGAK
jgi:hypothetical protein